MKVYLSTRGAVQDYQFVAYVGDESPPRRRWWVERYGTMTRFESPTIILEQKRGWRAFLSGIPSKRKDSVGTTINYSLMLEGQKASQDASTRRTVQSLIELWLEDAAELLCGKREASELGTHLDDFFTEAQVEKYFDQIERLAGEVGFSWKHVHASKEQAHLNAALEDFLAQFELLHESENDDKITELPQDRIIDSFIGAVRSLESRRLFGKQVRWMLAREAPGLAALLTLAQEADFRRLFTGMCTGLLLRSGPDRPKRWRVIRRSSAS